jgi:hypothetical protein
MSGFLSALGPLLSAGASIYGAVSANNAAKAQQQAIQQAAQTQQRGTDAQVNLLRQMYEQGRADLAPYRAAGTSALGTYAGQVNQPFQVSPGYQFAQDEGMRAILNNQATRGMLGSGQTLRATQRFGQGLANQEYGTYLNRLAALSGIGQTAATTGAQGAQTYGGQAAGAMGQGTNALANLAVGQGAARASGINAGANALMGGANNLLAYFMGQ